MITVWDPGNISEINLHVCLCIFFVCEKNPVAEQTVSNAFLNTSKVSAWGEKIKKLNLRAGANQLPVPEVLF